MPRVLGFGSLGLLEKLDPHHTSNKRRYQVNKLSSLKWLLACKRSHNICIKSEQTSTHVESEHLLVAVPFTSYTLEPVTCSTAGEEL